MYHYFVIYTSLRAYNITSFILASERTKNELNRSWWSTLNHEVIRKWINAIRTSVTRNTQLHILHGNVYHYFVTPSPSLNDFINLRIIDVSLFCYIHISPCLMISLVLDSLVKGSKMDWIQAGGVYRAKK